MKALITGGAGFIGSHLAEALCARGDSVIALDNLSLGSRDNLAWASGLPASRFEFVEGDVADETTIEKLVAGCDCVFHEAAMPSVPVSIAKPVESNAVNVDATLRLLVRARDARVRRFVFASSSSIYGEAPEPLKHESLPARPMSPYALQKFAAERYCQLFHTLYGFETVCLRYFNVFGPRQAFDSPYSGVIAKFCTSMLAGQAPVIFGDGQQSRDFIYIANVVEANLAAIAAPAVNVAGRVFNIAGGRSISLLDTVAELNRLTGQDLKPLFEPVRVGDVRHSRADLSAAREGLGYEVRVPWQEGFRRTLEFYRASASAAGTRLSSGKGG
jgi:UDP-glucose 4-epimerase